MTHQHDREAAARKAEVAAPGAPYEAPRYEVIALDCEITSYTPDDEPLF